MKRLILPIITAILSITMSFTSCSNDDVEPMIEQETSEIIIDTYVDGKLQTPTKATVYLDGGYATGAGKYKAKSSATVAAYPNQGYKLESFTGGEKNQWNGASSYYIEEVPNGTTYFTAKFKKEAVVQNVSLSINFIDKNVQNKFEHMWVDLTIDGNKTTVELDLRTGGWSSMYMTNVPAGSTYSLTNFRSHYVASGTANEARAIFNSTNNYGVVYCNEKSGSFGKGSTISGTLNSNVTYSFYID